MGTKKEYSQLKRNFKQDLTVGKLLPQAIDIEESVLGAMIIESSCVSQVFELIKNADVFYKESNQIIFQSILDLFKDAEPIDLRTITANIRKKNMLSLAGGPFHITELASKVVSSSNVESHCRLLLEYAIRRDVIRISSELNILGYDDSVDAFDLLDKAENSLFKVSEDAVSKNFCGIKEAFSEVVEMLQTPIGKDGITGVPSGFYDLDKMTAGWQPSDLIILAARPGMGKAQSLWSRIVTPDGYRLMGDIKVGDKVAGKNGCFNNVIGIFPQGKKKTYKITFSDETETYCCDEHLWYVESRKDRKNNRKGNVIDLKEIQKNLTVNKDNRLNYSIPYCDPVQFFKKYLPINPYILGLLLGDGCICNGRVDFSNPEFDLVNALEELLPSEDQINYTGHGVDFRITKKKKGKIKTTTRQLLESLGLYGKKSHNKFIPKSYLTSSVEDRIELLQGLLDSDGFVSKGQCNIEYVTVSEQLKEDTKFLVESLGGYITYNICTGSYTKNGEKHIVKDYYRINIALPSSITPFKSAKHLSKFKQREKPFRKFIQSVEFIGEYDCQCIMVDADDHLYLTDDFIVTHNTAFVVSAMRNASVEFNMPVAIFSLEMSKQQLVTRLMSSEAEIDGEKFKKRSLSDIEWEQLIHRTGKLCSSNIFIDDTPGLSMLELRAKARRLKNKHGIKLIVVDYLQLLQGEKGGNREQEISSIARGLKILAKELNVPVIALSQLSRSVETRGGEKRPMLSDLRESGSIEQDADMVMFLYRPEYYGITADQDGNPIDPGDTEVIIAKHRNGSLDNVYLKFIGRYTKFADKNAKSFSSPKQPEYNPNNFHGMTGKDLASGEAPF